MLDTLDTRYYLGLPELDKTHCQDKFTAEFPKVYSQHTIPVSSSSLKGIHHPISLGNTAWVSPSWRHKWPFGCSVKPCGQGSCFKSVFPKRIWTWFYQVGLERFYEVVISKKTLGNTDFWMLMLLMLYFSRNDQSWGNYGFNLYWRIARILVITKVSWSLVFQWRAHLANLSRLQLNLGDGKCCSFWNILIGIFPEKAEM